MEITGKVHCLFEQSGTFKNEFIKLGYESYDYDIQNNFGQTDNICDLFDEIEKGYNGGGSIFDTMTSEDLLIAFFPCIYFTGSSNPCLFRLDTINYKNMSLREKFDTILLRSERRQYLYTHIYKLVAICLLKGLRIIIENPFSPLHYLDNNFIQQPSYIDPDRRRRGDWFKKPTGYWFFNCEPTDGFTEGTNKIKKTIRHCKKASKSGLCSEERSMISPEYAHNFICDKILGKQQAIMLNLFDNI